MKRNSTVFPIGDSEGFRHAFHTDQQEMIQI